MYSCRLSSCCLYGERCTSQGKLWMCVVATQFPCTCCGMLLCYKADVSSRSCLQECLFSHKCHFLFAGSLESLQPVGLTWREGNQLFPASLPSGVLSVGTSIKSESRVANPQSSRKFCKYLNITNTVYFWASYMDVCGTALQFQLRRVEQSKGRA